ncbi:MAG: DUF3574 domain-containing protein [Acidobacteriota bacterium]
MKNRLAVAATLILILGLSPIVLNAGPILQPEHRAAIVADKFYRTELYFGRSIKGGDVVSEEQWRQFLATEVTPRFPDGFTVLEGYGQYRDKSGKITSEPSTVIVFLYPAASKKNSRAKIDEIRAAYVKKFDQESVLRMDFRSPVEVVF